MAHSNGKSDGERSRSADAGSVPVARGEHGHHQHEREEQLVAEGLRNRHAGTRRRRAQRLVRAVRRQRLENAGSGHRAERLYHDVQERAAGTRPTNRNNALDSAEKLGISKHEKKISGTICVGVPNSKFWRSYRGLLPRNLQWIYAPDMDPSAETVNQSSSPIICTEVLETESICDHCPRYDVR